MIPAGEGDEADGEVVGHDVAGGLGRDADDGLGPHLVALHGGDHLRATKWRMNSGRAVVSDGAEQPQGHGNDQQGREDEADLTLGRCAG